MKLVSSVAKRCVHACLLLITIWCSLSLQAQQKTTAVTGIVRNEAGEPLAGVSVSARNSKTKFQAGATTNEQGIFIFEKLPAGGPYDFNFSSVGFEGVTLSGYTIREDATVNVVAKLKDITKVMDQVVVTGYSRQSRRDVTGAVSTISAAEVAQTPSTDITSVLQGRVAGVTVDGQGGPGNQQVVRVRGIGTLGSNDPLYVIDGVQTTGGLNLVNQNDIETLTVLKDAASCALYGARGSNGVIVITTKRGKNGAPRLEYNGYAGWEIPGKFPSMMSSQQYADAYWGYLKNSSLPLSSPIYGAGATPVLPDFIIENTTSTPFFGGVAASDPKADPALYNLNNYRIMEANKAGTDWWGEVLKPAFTQNHQLAVSGATDKSNYALTFNYLDNNGILLNSYFKRYSLRVNTEFKVKPWLRFGENFQFSYGKQNTVSDPISSKDQNVIANLYKISPIMPVRDIAGNFTGTKGSSGLDGSNPVTSRELSKNFNGYTARAFGAAYVEVEPMRGLVFQSKITIDYLPYQNRYYKDIMPQDQYDNGRNSFSENGGYSMEWRNTNKLSCDKTIGVDHKIGAFIAYEASQYETRYLGGTNDSLFSLAPGFLVLGTGAVNTARLSGGQDKYTYASVFGNVNYAFRDKYLLGFTIRRDGSSRFGPLNRYGTFPSVSLGWRVSAESFMNNVKWVDDLKLRAAVGSAGNDGSLPSGSTISQYVPNVYYSYYDLNGTNINPMQGFALQQIGNPYLQWEVNNTTNLGFDAAFFKRSLTLSFNWFNRVTNKLLYQPPVTALQGDALKPYQNVMNFVNKGIELELGYNGFANRDFHYDINFNIATYRNNVKYIDGDSATVILGDKFARATSLTRSQVGHPVSSFYGYQYDGMFQAAEDVTGHADQPGIDKAHPETGLGHFRFKDISGPDGKPDGKIDQNDQTYIGNPHPKFTYGFNVNLFYKNIDLGIFLQGVYGNKIMNYWRTFYEWPGAYSTAAMDTWSPTNTAAKLPIYSNNTSTLDAQSSDFFVEDGSYLRLKSLQLGYTFKGLKGISKLRVYVQAYNLFTITNYSGLDPEVNTGAPGSIGVDFGGNYPISKKVLFGVNLAF